MKTETTVHESVLLQESIEGLALATGDVFLDATAGGGGHSELVAKTFGKNVHIICIDADADALTRTEAKLQKHDAHFTLILGNFRDAKRLLAERGITQVNKVLFDLGMSSDQFESGRGFSFQKDEPLIMTMQKPSADGTNKPLVTAHDIVNKWQESSIADVIYGFGEERYARRIARVIVDTREAGPIDTTAQLVEIILAATPSRYHHGKIHPATKTFQALRIAVNDEYGALAEGLLGAWELLAQNGRIAVISFHSGEDRIVKNFFREKSKAGEATLLVKKPLTPSRDEILHNRRSRSAKLRLLQKTEEK